MPEPRERMIPLPTPRRRDGGAGVRAGGPSGGHRLLPRQRLQRPHLPHDPAAAGGGLADPGARPARPWRQHPADGDRGPRRAGCEFRDDLLALLAAACEAPVVLAGHSMGGTSSLLAAAAEPARVRALALFDPVVMPARRRPRRRSPESPLVAGRASPPRASSQPPGRVRGLSRAAAPSRPGARRSWPTMWPRASRETADGEVDPDLHAGSGKPRTSAPTTTTPGRPSAQSRCPIRILRAERRLDLPAGRATRPNSATTAASPSRRSPGPPTSCPWNGPTWCARRCSPARRWRRLP